LVRGTIATKSQLPVKEQLRKLSGRGILEYFAPLFTWLKERNKQLDIEPGWDADECKYWSKYPTFAVS